MTDSTANARPSATAPRRRLFMVLAAVVLVVSSWWQWRADYYLWRIRAHDHGPSRAALRHVGPRALPDLYAELRELGSEPVGSYRSDLVRVVASIRSDLVRDRTGAWHPWEVAAVLEPPDAEMLEVLATAIGSEPDVEQQRSMVVALGELDFNMHVALTCAVFPSMAPAARDWLLLSLEPVRLAWTEFDATARDDFWPWRDAGDEAIAATQQTMREALVCVPPLLLAALEQHQAEAHAKSRDAQYHVVQLVETLGEFDELDPELLTRLIELVGTTKDGEVVRAVVDQLGDRLVATDVDALQAALGRALRHADGDHRMIVHAIGKLSERHQDDGLSHDALFCDAFAETDDETRAALLDPRRLGSSPCINEVMMAAYERRIGSPEHAKRDDVANPWMLDVELLLRDRLADDPRIGVWAKRVSESFDDASMPAGLELLVVAASAAPPEGR